MRHLSIATLVVLVGASPLAAQVEESVQRTISVGSAASFELDVDRGAIEIRPGSSDSVELEVRFSARESSSDELAALIADFTLDVQPQGGTIRVTGRLDRDGARRARRRWLRGVEYRVSVPERFGVDLRTAGGAVSVEDLNGAVEARTSGGSLSFARIDGAIDGNTSGGSIMVREAGQDVHLRTSGGSIQIEGVAGDVDARTSGGSINVEDVAGYLSVRTSGGSIRLSGLRGGVDASTSGGGVTASFDARTDEDARLSTSGGGITVTLGPDAGFNVEASGNRVVATDFGISNDPRRRGSLEAPINGGGPALQLRTSGGTIRIRSGNQG